MGDFGFWALAHEHPDKLALVDADGTEYTRRRAARAGPTRWSTACAASTSAR